MKVRSLNLKKELIHKIFIFGFGIQNLREIVESSKHVTNRGKLDKQRACLSSMAKMALKTQPSKNYKSFKFNDYKLLDNQIERVVEVWVK